MASLRFLKGHFTPVKGGACRAYVFGRAKRDIERIAGLLHISFEEAFGWAIDDFVRGLQSILNGESAVFRTPNGEVLDVWNGPKCVKEDYYRLLDEEDGDSDESI